MTYEIEQERPDTHHIIDVLGAWVVYLMLIVSLTGYHLVQVVW